MKTITILEFKAKSLKYLDQVAETGETIVITKNGRPMVELGPAKEPAPIKKRVDALFGRHKGQIHIMGDIVSPLYSEWEVVK